MAAIAAVRLLRLAALLPVATGALRAGDGAGGGVEENGALNANASTTASSCCCTAADPEAGGCEPGQFYVESTLQCCAKLPSTACHHFLMAWVPEIHWIQEWRSEKCTPGDHGAGIGRVARQLTRPELLGAALEVRSAGTHEWSRLWGESFARASALRATLGRPEEFHEGEHAELELTLWHQGEVVKHHSLILDAKSLAGGLLQINLAGDLLHKMYHARLKVWRTSDAHPGWSSSVLTEEFKVYASPSQECGVGFLPSRNRDCKLMPESSVKVPLTVPLKDYAFGVEYQLAAAPGQGPAAAALLEATSDVNAATNLSVTGLPCIFACHQVKSCLWKKLRWDAAAHGEEWGIEADSSVGVLTPEETDEKLQHQGVPFEIVSPPLVGMAGLRNAMEVLTAVRDMGAQAPLSAGLHVHINMRSKKVGSKITSSMKEVFAVWLNWARYQHVIDEMLSPSRVDNEYAQSVDLEGIGLDEPRAAAVRDIFSRGHEAVWKLMPKQDKNMDQAAACAALIGEKLFPFCAGYRIFPHGVWVNWNPEKFFELNLTPLGRFGTLEFRAGTATLDPERVARWVQFLVGFVDAFKDPATVEEFMSGTVEEDYAKLLHAQRHATVEDLAMRLEGSVEPDFYEYFATGRPFEKQDGASTGRVGCVNLVKNAKSAWGTSQPVSPQDNPGERLIAKNDLDAKAIIVQDFAAAQAAAPAFPLNAQFDLYAHDFEEDYKALSTFSWEELTIWRIQASYGMRSLGTVWEDDKLDQKCIVESEVPSARYVEYFVDTDAADAERCRKRSQDRSYPEQVVEGLIAKKEPFIVKASHGANSNAVFAFCDPSKLGYSAAAAKRAIGRAYNSAVASSENWQIRVVEPGVVIQKCYNSNFSDDGRPLEVKVLTQWGRVVGATLETRPKEFWITRAGEIWEWQGDQTSTGLISRMAGKGVAAAEKLNRRTMAHLLRSLRAQWLEMRDVAEAIATEFGNDELRVDFFFGNLEEGPRLNEITYMGGAARYPLFLQSVLANTFVAGYSARAPCSVFSEVPCKTPIVPSNCHDYAAETEKLKRSPSASLYQTLRYQALHNLGINLGQGAR